MFVGPETKAPAGAVRRAGPGRRAPTPGCLAVGPTMPTGFGDQFDPVLTGEMFEVWTKKGMIIWAAMETEAVAEVIVETVELLLRNPGISLDYMVLRPVEPAKA